MLGWLLYKIGSLVPRLLPLKQAYRVAMWWASMWYSLNDHYARELRDNIAQVLGRSPDSPEVRRIGHHIFRTFSKTICEFLKFPRLSPAELEELVEIKGQEIFDRALEGRKGVVIFSAHLGNWELGAAYLGTKGYQIYGIFLDHSRTMVNAMFDKYRRSMGVHTLSANAFLRPAIKILRKGGAVAFITDWDVFGTGQPVKFFGRMTTLPKGAVYLAMRTGAILLPVFILRLEDDRHQIIFENPIPLVQKGDKNEALRENLARVVEIMETYISSNLEQWAMFHRIWKE